MRPLLQKNLFSLNFKQALISRIWIFLTIYINIISILRQSGFQQQLNQTDYQIAAKGVQRNFSFLSFLAH